MSKYDGNVLTSILCLGFRPLIRLGIAGIGGLAKVANLEIVLGDGRGDDVVVVVESVVAGDWVAGVVLVGVAEEVTTLGGDNGFGLFGDFSGDFGDFGELTGDSSCFDPFFCSSLELFMLKYHL